MAKVHNTNKFVKSEQDFHLKKINTDATLESDICEMRQVNPSPKMTVPAFGRLSFSICTEQKARTNKPARLDTGNKKQPQKKLLSEIVPTKGQKFPAFEQSATHLNLRKQEP